MAYTDDTHKNILESDWDCPEEDRLMRSTCKYIRDDKTDRPYQPIADNPITFPVISQGKLYYPYSEHMYETFCYIFEKFFKIHKNLATVVEEYQHLEVRCKDKEAVLQLILGE